MNASDPDVVFFFQEPCDSDVVGLLFVSIYAVSHPGVPIGHASGFFLKAL